MTKSSTQNPHASAPMLTACLAAARIDAQRFFSEQPPPAWKPRVSRRTRWWLLGALALATGGVAATVWQRQAPHVPQAAAQPRPATHPALLWDLPSAGPVPTAIEAPTPTAPMAEPVAEPKPAQAQPLIERLDNGELRIRLVAHDRRDAAERLAVFTGARLLERPEALAQTRPVTLHWQGRDTATAWRALLADDAHYLLDCRVERACKLWIFGAHGASATDARTHPAAALSPDASSHAPPDVATAAAMTAPASALPPDSSGPFPTD